MKIEKGMFIRTQQGIAKIVEKPNISVVVWNDRKVIYVDKNGHPVATSLNFFVFEDEITSVSFDLIDLIEVGDYVNGEKVQKKYFNYAIKDWRIESNDGIICFNENIKDVVTKEQFLNCKYVVERATNE